MNIKIGNKKISEAGAVFIIAELSANHNQDFDLAVKTMQAMKEAGADAVKVQTYTPDTITLNCQNKYFQIKQGTIWDGQTLYNLYEKAYLPWDWQPKLKKVAEDLGLIFFSSPFDNSAVDFLEKMKVPAYKIASFEITDIPLIEYVASTGKPVLISTGVATQAEIKEALAACYRQGNKQVILLKCTSAYPAPFSEMNLKTIPDLARRFKVPVGLSDHTLGQTTAIAGVALGAKIVEKHFILDRKLGGPDATFSMEPTEFKQMVQAIRDAELALGKISYKLSPKTRQGRDFCRSLFVVKDIKKGEELTEQNIRSIRPGQGLAPKYFKQMMGKKAQKDIGFGVPLQLDMLE